MVGVFVWFRNSVRKDEQLFLYDEISERKRERYEFLQFSFFGVSFFSMCEFFVEKKRCRPWYRGLARGPEARSRHDASLPDVDMGTCKRKGGQVEEDEGGGRIEQGG